MRCAGLFGVNLIQARVILVYLFNVYKGFADACLSLVPAEVREVIPWNWSYGWLCAAL